MATPDSSYVPPQTLLVQLSRYDPGVPWGFRLQGGTDFNTPISVVLVQPNSVSEKCGLKAGDGILRINNANTDALTHEAAKMEIVRSGNQIEMLVARGAKMVWKPQIVQLSAEDRTPIKTATGETIIPIQRTSLVANKPKSQGPSNIGSSHNRSARPFGAAAAPSKVATPKVMHSQYNSPIGLYSADNIAHSYASQTAGIQKEMEGLDIQRQDVGTRMSGGTYQPM